MKLERKLEGHLRSFRRGLTYGRGEEMQEDEPEEERKDLGLPLRVSQVEDNVTLSGKVLNLSCGGRDGDGPLVNLEVERALRMTFQGAWSLAGCEFMSV